MRITPVILRAKAPQRIRIFLFPLISLNTKIAQIEATTPGPVAMIGKETTINRFWFATNLNRGKYRI
jgi:hypothetical protein